MLRTMLKSRIHRATVTTTDSGPAGSVTVDADLLDAVDLLTGERVVITDAVGGARLEAAVVAGARGTGVVGVSGADAHLIRPGDEVVLTAYGMLDEWEARTFRPSVVFLDANNRVAETRADPGTDAGAEEPLSPEISVETADAAKLDALLHDS